MFERQPKIIVAAIVASVLLLLIGGNAAYSYISERDTANQANESSQQQNVEAKDTIVSDYIKTGMTKAEVRDVLGEESEECEKNRGELAGTETCTYIATDNILGLSGRAFGVVYESDGTVSTVSEVKF